MSNRCPKCDNYFVNGFCKTCGFRQSNNNSLQNHDICEKCGKRGRRINVHGFRVRAGDLPNYIWWEPKGIEFRTYCFHCYKDLDGRKGFYGSYNKRNMTTQEILYQKVLEMYYLIPSFYGDHIDEDKLQIANDTRIGINRHLWEKIIPSKELEVGLQEENSLPEEWSI